MPRPLPRLVALVALSAFGCEGEPTDEEVPAVPPPVVSSFDAARSGTVTGRVVWSGPEPVVPPFLCGIPRSDKTGFDSHFIPNPNAPRIHPASKAVAGAVVFLRGVNPTAAKPWDHPPVKVEARDRQIVVRQGEAEPRRVGFVRRGDPVTITSADSLIHVLRARGAAFFSLAFPDPDKPLTRVLEKPGRVELSSGSGFYWASADLFVDDHPYYTLTDADGRFTLTQVPEGPAELVAWLPGWEPIRQERDPESGLVTRLTWSPAVEVRLPLRVEAGRVADCPVTISRPAR